MKTKLLILPFLLVTGMVWGQKKKSCVDSIPQYKIITKVEISNDTLKVKGWINEKTFSEHCKKIDNAYYVYTNKTNYRSFLPKVSLITVPIKVRPKNKLSQSNVDAGLDNLGVNLDFIYHQRDKYFATGGNSTHRFSAGVLLAPLVQELTKDNTKNQSGNSKQLFLSTGITLNYSYNKILFTVVPMGFDFGFNNAGKDWTNNGKYWWGFGIGADLKILEKVIE